VQAGVRHWHAANLTFVNSPSLTFQFAAPSHAAGKQLPVIIAAIAREMVAFLWGIGRQITPAAFT